MDYNYEQDMQEVASRMESSKLTRRTSSKPSAGQTPKRYSARIEKPRSSHQSPRAPERRRTLTAVKQYVSLDDHYRKMFGLEDEEEKEHEQEQYIIPRPVSWHPSSSRWNLNDSMMACSQQQQAPTMAQQSSTAGDNPMAVYASQVDNAWSSYTHCQAVPHALEQTYGTTSYMSSMPQSEPFYQPVHDHVQPTTQQDQDWEEDARDEFHREPSTELIGLGLYDPPGTTLPFMHTGAKGLKLEETWQPPEEMEDADADEESEDEEDEPPRPEDSQLSQTELLSVRKLLYAETDTTNPETLFRSQRLGVNIVNTWKRRCRVPHYIDFTAVLVDAQLQHNVEQHSAFTIRAIYSTAFARFVTGTCDMGQNSASKRSMYEMAEDNDMPEKWVELRHEITHGEIPDLRVLEFSVNAALSWLWDKFWTNLDAPVEDNSEARTDIRTVLRSFVHSRKEEIKLCQSAGRESCAITTRKLLRMCKNSETSQTQSKLNNMKPAYVVWDDLLQTIAAKRPSFYSTLIENLLNGISLNSVNPEDEVRKRALVQWLLHLMTVNSWQKSLRPSEELRSTILERCVTHPDSCSKRLARAVLDKSDKDFQDQWEPYFEISFLDIDSEDDEAPPPRHGQSDKPGKHFDHKPNMARPESSIGPRKHRPLASDIPNEAPVLKEVGGWRLWEGGWLPKPIGFPHPQNNQ
ncbi:hypothetical protein BLS_000424 [Venturia inaequalis]|uniref:Uncharacterized protein n=1 Tax=Venturia inaequalis TaxID=5025 RepID=A0A8H3U351_VENIN|nr:hypothetical protein BLS_000424 [Venturia inaequalis]